MNDRQIDSLLEEARAQQPPEITPQRTEAICGGLRTGIRHRHRIERTALASGVVLVVALWGLMFHRTKNAEEEQTASAVVLEKLAMARTVFPETGVALVNGEVMLVERQEKDGGGRQYLQIRLAKDGQELVSVDVIVSDDDYVVFDEGPVTGEVLVSRCDGESIVDCDLVVRRPDGRRDRLKEAIVLNAPDGGRMSARQAVSGEGAPWRISLESVHRS